MFIPPLPVPVLAQPRPAAEAAISDLTTLSFGPTRTTRGWQLSLSTVGCAKHMPLSARYAEVRGRATLIHEYTGRIGACAVSSGGAGEITVMHRGALSLRAILTPDGRPTVSHLKFSKHCAATLTHIRLTATGTIAANLHGAVLGTVHSTHLTGTLERAVIPECALTGSAASLLGSGAAPKIADLTILATTGRGTENIFGVAAPGLASETTFSETANDGPVGMQQDQFSATVAGRGALVPARSLDHATVDFASPVTHGSLTFTAGLGCPADVHARDGRVRGSVSVTDPILGSLRLTGSQLGEANLGEDLANVGTCKPAVY